MKDYIIENRVLLGEMNIFNYLYRLQRIQGNQWNFEGK